MKHVLLKGIVPKIMCNDIVLTFNGAYGGSQKELPIKDKNNFSNTLYTSNRSPGLQYKYLKAGVMKETVQQIKSKLEYVTGEFFNGPITDFCLPVFKYLDQGEILAHKDVEKTQEKPKFQNMVAVLMLTEPGKDFLGGRFYVNDKADCSEDGKIVTNDRESDRYYPDMEKGDIFVFDNACQVHGVEKVHVSQPKQIGRYTCSFRTY